MVHFQPIDLTQPYEFVAQLTPEFPVDRLCNTLAISRSAYYAYHRMQTYKPTPRQPEIQQRATALLYEHQRRYGSRRLLLDL